MVKSGTGCAGGFGGLIGMVWVQGGHKRRAGARTLGSPRKDAESGGGKKIRKPISRATVGGGGLC